MNIDRNICEAYFLDYYEGRLNREEIEALFGFLDQHPELKSEFEAYGSVPDTDVLLTPSENDSLEFTESLKKQTTDDDLIALLEGQLSVADRKALEDLLEQDKMLTSRFALFQQTISQPDLHIQYPNKKHLKKGAPVIPMLLRYGAVAALLSGAFLSVWIYQHQGPTQSITALDNSGAISKEKTESSGPESTKQSAVVNSTDNSDEMATNEEDESTASYTSVNSSKESNPAQVKDTNSDRTQTATESKATNHSVRQNEFETLAVLEPIPVSALPAPKIDSELRGTRVLENITDLTTADLPGQKEEPTNPTSEPTLFGAFLSDVGTSMVDRVKTVAGDRVVVDKEEHDESDVVTSSFKLGSFEIYRSRAKK